MATWFDRYSSGHFLLGSMNYVVWKRLGVSDDVNFIFTNTIHLLIECLEHPMDPDGNILESVQNHFGDILAFFFGWMCSYYFHIENLLWPGIYPLLYIGVLGTVFNEVVREIFPYVRFGLLQGAYTVQSENPPVPSSKKK